MHQAEAESQGLAASTKTGQARELVLDLLSESEVCEFMELVEKGSEVGVRKHVVLQVVNSLLKEGLVSRASRGCYSLADSLIDLQQVEQ